MTGTPVVSKTDFIVKDILVPVLPNLHYTIICGTGDQKVGNKRDIIIQIHTSLLNGKVNKIPPIK